MIIEHFDNPPRTMPSERDAIVIKLREELIEAKALIDSLVNHVKKSYADNDDAMKRVAELEKERDAALIRIAELEEDDGNDLFQPDGTWTHVRVD